MDYDELTLSLLGKAEDLKMQGQGEEAIKVLQKILMDNPQCVEAYEEIGDNYLAMRELDKAKAALSMAIQTDKTSANGHYLMGFLYSIQELWTKSIEELEVADKLTPNHPEILRCLGWGLFNAQQKEVGISLLERARNLSPVDPNILCDLGICYINVQQTEKAEIVLLAALKIDPESPQALECLNMLGALKKGKKEISGNPNDLSNLI